VSPWATLTFPGPLVPPGARWELREKKEDPEPNEVIDALTNSRRQEAGGCAQAGA